FLLSRVLTSDAPAGDTAVLPEDSGFSGGLEGNPSIPTGRPGLQAHRSRACPVPFWAFEAVERNRPPERRLAHDYGLGAGNSVRYGRHVHVIACNGRPQWRCGL